jgi:hypothetical protein
MSAARRDKAPDPLGKRALYWLPSAGESSGGGPPSSETTVALPVGRRALFSGARPRRDGLVASDNPLAERGTFTVQCERCRQTSHIGVLDLLIFQLPVGVWLPRGRFDHRMTCPSCRVRAWCSVTIRRA